MRADRLRAVREQRHLSQQDLADRIGVHVKQIGRYESGANDPTGDVLKGIAQALEVSTDYLLGLVDEPSAHLREEDLSPMERKLIQAFRRGLIVEASKAFTALAEEVDKSSIPPGEPAVNS